MAVAVHRAVLSGHLPSRGSGEPRAVSQRPQLTPSC